MTKLAKIKLSDVESLPLTYEQIIPEDYMDLMNHMNVMWYTHLFSMAIMKVFGIIGLTRTDRGEDSQPISDWLARSVTPVR